MKDALMKVSINLQSMTGKIKDRLQDEEGQDLIEYALIIALIAFGAVTGMKALATGINTAFGTIVTTLNGYLA